MRGDEQALDHGGGGGVAAVEVHGGDDGLEGVGEDGALGAAAAAVLALAEAQPGAEAEARGDLGEPGFAHHLGPGHRQLALAQGREPGHEAVADDQIEHGVAEELEALVVAAGGVGVLVQPRGVAQGRSRVARSRNW
jgi:hypothetical protein